MSGTISKQEELVNCSFIKTILMFLVILVHSTDYWTGTWFTAIPLAAPNPVLSFFSDFVGSFHVYTFILISGYIFGYLKNEKKSYNDFSLFMKNKVKRLIVPYLSASLLWVIPITQFFFHYDFQTIASKYILATNPSQLWFLWVLFDIFVMIWPISHFIHGDISMTIICIVFYLFPFAVSSKVPNLFCILSSFRYFPFFVLGMKIREKPTGQFYKLPTVAYILLYCIFFFLKNIISEDGGLIYKALHSGFSFLTHFTGAAMGFFVFQKAAQMLNERGKGKRLSSVGKNMMVIYLLHQQIIYFVIYIVNGKVNLISNVILNFFCSFIISYLISSVLLRYKLTRFLVGEKPLDHLSAHISS